MGIQNTYNCIRNRLHHPNFRVSKQTCLCELRETNSLFNIRSSQTAYNKVLMANAATSAFRLHQRLPPIQFTREFLSLLLMEDSCHYLFFSLIFLYVSPLILILTPVVLFAVLHSASYSLTLLDVSETIRM